MQEPIGAYNCIVETPTTGLGVAVKLPYARSKSFHYRAAGTGAGTAVFQPLGSNVTKPSATNVGDWFPIGAQVTVTFTGSTTVSDGTLDNTPCLWVNCQLVSITSGGQAECWIAG